MNVRMMLFGRKAATDNSPENDLMTKSAIEFMESQVKDPKLREIVRPNSKCNASPRTLFLTWLLTPVLIIRLL
jgi:hypothetical protein